MELDILKETTIEYCENIYALAINYLKNNNNLELNGDLKELNLLESKIRICNEIDLFNNYKNLLNQLIKKIEAIINE